MKGWRAMEIRGGEWKVLTWDVASEGKGRNLMFK